MAPICTPAGLPSSKTTELGLWFLLGSSSAPSCPASNIFENGPDSFVASSYLASAFLLPESSLDTCFELTWTDHTVLYSFPRTKNPIADTMKLTPCPPENYIAISMWFVPPSACKQYLGFIRRLKAFPIFSKASPLNWREILSRGWPYCCCDSATHSRIAFLSGAEEVSVLLGELLRESD